MTKRYATLMTDGDADQLQEAAEDVAWLTSQGCGPTEAIAKVASAARFPVPKTRLLTYAYTNGVAAEKRFSPGGPFERLAEFPMPDPNEIHRLVYGEPEKEAELPFDPFGHDSDSSRSKTASVPVGFLPLGMATFDRDISRLDRSEIRALFGLPVKTAGDRETDDDGNPIGCGFSIAHTSIRIGLGPAVTDEGNERDESGPSQSFQDKLSSMIRGLPPEPANELETTLIRMLGLKKKAMIDANAEADDAFYAACRSLDRLGGKLNHRHLSPETKRAGLLSVRAYHPEIADLLLPYPGEVNARLIKESACGPLDVNASHPWVAEAAALERELGTVADLTLAANRKTAEYRAVRRLYEHRAALKKTADWSSFLAGSLMPGIGSGAKDLLLGSDQSERKKAIENEVLGELDDPWHDLQLRDIKTRSMINRFGTSDEVLSAYPMSKLLKRYNRLLQTVPNLMRDETQANALLTQYMTQGGGMAPSEIKPALEMNKLDPRKTSLEKREKKSTDE